MMVNSHVALNSDFDPNKSRVITRKLNTVIKNPPSMQSMGLRNVALVPIAVKRRQSQIRRASMASKDKIHMMDS